MITLGLDPSLTNFGWCLYEGDKNEVLGKGLFKTTNELSFIERNIYLRTALQQLIKEATFDKVGVESPLFNDIYSEGMYGLFLFACEALRNCRQDVVFFSPMQVKAHARDSLSYQKGWKMQKGDMVNAVKKKVAEPKKWNHNEADAFWVAFSANRFWSHYENKISLEDLSDTEKDQFTRSHTFTRGKKAGLTEKTGIIHKENERFFLWSAAGDEFLRSIPECILNPVPPPAKGKKPRRKKSDG